MKIAFGLGALSGRRAEGLPERGFEEIMNKNKNRGKLGLIAFLLTIFVCFGNWQTAYGLQALDPVDYGALLTLDEAISKTLQDHAQVKMAIERFEKEKALYKAKRAEFFPKLGTEIFQGVSTGEKRSVTYFDTLIEQPIFQGGKTIAEKNKQKVKVEEETLKLEQTKLDLELEVRILYAEVLKEKELTRIAQGAVKELSQGYDRVKILSDKEMIARYELLRTETLLQKAKESLVLHKETYDCLFAFLKETVGLGEDKSIELEALDDFREIDAQMRAFLEAARSNDPLYKLKELAVKEKEYEKKSLEADRYPHISLGAKWNIYQDVFVDANRGMLGVFGRWNIWDFGRLGAQIQAKAHEIEETKWAGEIEKNKNERQIRRYFHDARAVLEKIKSCESMAREREEGYKNEKVMVIAGEKGSGELLDSFLALIQSRIEYLQAVTEYRCIFARLERSTCFKLAGGEANEE